MKKLFALFGLLLIVTPVFADYVPYPVSSVGNKVRHDFVRLAASSAGVCTINSASGNFVLGTPVGGINSCATTFATAYSSVPACHCNTEGSVTKTCQIASVSTSAVTTTTLVASTGADTTQAVSISCTGNR